MRVLGSLSCPRLPSLNCIMRAMDVTIGGNTTWCTDTAMWAGSALPVRIYVTVLC